MSEHDNDVMVALLPTSTEWSSLPIPHLTLVYAGEISKSRPTDFQNLAKECSHLAAISSRITAIVDGKETLGGGDNPYVEAYVFKPNSELSAMRHFLEKWNKSEYKEFKPHMTIGPLGSKPPMDGAPVAIRFDRLLVAWGNDQLIFKIV